MECRKCRFQNPEGARFCSLCGSEMEPECRKCGKFNPVGSKFCNQCGESMGEAKDESAVDRAPVFPYTPKYMSETYLTKKAVVDGERKPVTVMFVDVVNSTGLFERLDSEEVHWIMDRCFKRLGVEIHHYGGTINQFMGDGIMALFGAPVAQEDHAVRACRAALAIQEAMIAFGANVQTEYGVRFQVRIGINSGPVVVGAIGDDLRRDYTAISRTVSLACRFESQALPGTIVLSKETRRLVDSYFSLRCLGKVEVKGVSEPQEIFELLNAGEASSRIEASAKKGLTRFVGRSDSMTALMDAYAKAAGGSGQVVGVVGEVGVGKSRMLYEFRQRLSPHEYCYLEGRCIHYGEVIPYLPVLDILKTCFGIVQGESEVDIQKKVRQKILQLDGGFKEILPPLQDLLSLQVEDEIYLGLESKHRREKVFAALRALLLHESLSRPIIIAIEDLHWIDKVSEAFLDSFIQAMGNNKVMLILLYRPEYTCLWASRSCFNRIGLIQLTRSSGMDLIRSILPGAEITPEVFAFIMRRSAGNPLFMEELTHGLVEDGILRMQDHRYVLSLPSTGLQVPETIQGIIAARIDRLEEEVKKIMQLASVIGKEFTYRVLRAISDLEKDLRSQLSDLQGMELIYAKSVFPELEFVFKHALTVEVTYNSLLSNRKKEIHHSIGRAIEKLFAENLEEHYEVLAHHYAMGQQNDKASFYLKASGKKATHNHALNEAYDYYRRALQLLDRLPDGPEKKMEMIEVIQLMRIPMTLLGFPEDSLQFLQLGERLSMEVNDARRLAGFYALMGTYLSHDGDHLAAIRCAEKGLEKAGPAREVELIAPLGVTVCTSYSALNRYDRLVGAMPEILGRIEESGRQTDFFSLTVNPYSYICGACGAAMGHLGKFDGGETYTGKALQNARKIGHAATLGTAHFNYGWLLYTKGAYLDAGQHLEACIPFFDEAQWHLGVALASCCLGHVDVLLGRPEDGKQRAEKGIRMYRQSGIELYWSWCQWVVGTIYFDLRDFGNASRNLEAALNLSRKNGEQGVEGLALVALGRIAGAGEPSQVGRAEAYISEGLAILTRLEMKPWIAQALTFAGELHLNRGASAAAWENLEKAASMFQEMEMAYWLDRTRRQLASITN